MAPNDPPEDPDLHGNDTDRIETQGLGARFLNKRNVLRLLALLLLVGFLSSYAVGLC